MWTYCTLGAVRKTFVCQTCFLCNMNPNQATYQIIYALFYKKIIIIQFCIIILVAVNMARTYCPALDCIHRDGEGHKNVQKCQIVAIGSAVWRMSSLTKQIGWTLFKLTLKEDSGAWYLPWWHLQHRLKKDKK